MTRNQNVLHCFGDAVRNEARTSVAAFREKTGFDYTVRKDPVYQLTDRGYREVANQFHLVASCDERVVSPATVGKRYSIIQPGTLVDTVAPLVHEGIAEFDRFWRAGPMEGLLLALGKPIACVPGDVSTFQNYLLCANYHGRGSALISMLSIRVTCTNMWRMAMSGGETIRVPHTGDADDRYRLAFGAVEQLQTWYRENLPTLVTFAEKTVPVTDTVEDILGITAKRAKDPELVTSRAIAQRDRIIEATLYSPGVTGRGTALDVLNGVSYVNSHELGSNPLRAGLSCLEGARAALEKRAVTVLRERLSLN